MSQPFSCFMHLKQVCVLLVRKWKEVFEDQYRLKCILFRCLRDSNLCSQSAYIFHPKIMSTVQVFRTQERLTTGRKLLRRLLSWKQWYFVDFSGNNICLNLTEISDNSYIDDAKIDRPPSRLHLQLLITTRRNLAIAYETNESDFIHESYEP